MEPVERSHIPAKLLFDKRMVNSNLRSGVISLDEYNNHMKDLSCKGKMAEAMDFKQYPPEEPVETEEVSDTENNENIDKLEE